MPGESVDFSQVGYGCVAVVALVLMPLVASRWRDRLPRLALLLVLILSVGWAAALGSGEVSLRMVLALEVMRGFAWMVLLWRMMAAPANQDGWRLYLDRQRMRPRLALGAAAYLLLGVTLMLWPELSDRLTARIRLGADGRVVYLLLLNVFGLLMVELFYRNTRVEQRWGIKFLAIAIGALFAYDFALYTEALLFARINPTLFGARGFVNAALLPLIGVTAARLGNKPVELFVSRRVVVHTTALMGAGLYLLVMASIGYYLRNYGGSWGGVIQILFLSGAVVLLVALFFSGTLRARLRVFFAKNFFAHRYDYREAWLKLSRELAALGDFTTVTTGGIKLLADLVESSAGTLWWQSEQEGYRCCGAWGMALESDARVDADDSLAHFLCASSWVVELPEYLRTPEMYRGLDLASWQQRYPQLWLVVPLMRQEALAGFVCLLKPRVQRAINWEDHDLLKTVGIQLANHIALVSASEELARARQFEAFNRLSAFIVHDLKNVVAQLSLVVTNAQRYKHNPEFIDDALDTLANAVTKMNRMLGQLRQRAVEAPDPQRTELCQLAREVVALHRHRQPVPTLSCQLESLMLRADRERLGRVMGHLLQNAQEATAPQGRVELSVETNAAGEAVVRVSDTGCGMDQKFIDERLFRPFDTTKGNAGMGIGVFEVEQYIRSIGGRVEVQSEPGLGTRFVLTMPLMH
ncbi:MAG TPA: PEP-CTERM system histidine kinase PrsK [Pseudomonadales bacterium]|jgi:putative PEP-CTERM system histidine kinase|nr:PEP-CTERM system histidine kinase PrsK [Pseudomonadales bacterium]HNC76074.1 PEP-CTERM system histidine kinase PrsK [Pseudomonadales bacterium]HND26383.1 PEP-CTERM system histidine kinase PrsK [Pseudomonadales bacterium]HNF73876.1 PEP-CTERM system histidine kinase PrsK [Pseudomonadales bacterium]HNH19686.1 PEP-CTERM system histidine kinase PrsK [Pseudomonadales bacterium]